MDAMRGADYETVTLNIGLVNNPLENLTAREIANYLATVFEAARGHYGVRDGTVVHVQIVNPLEDTSNATERTAVVEYSGEDVVPALLRGQLEVLCVTLQQQAIAAWIDHDDGREPSKGFLAGPNAADWGPFDPSKFEIGDANAGSWAASNVLETVQ